MAQAPVMRARSAKFNAGVYLGEQIKSGIGAHEAEIRATDLGLVVQLGEALTLVPWTMVQSVEIEERPAKGDKASR